MKCEVCGTENEKGSFFCQNCGHELVKIETNNYQTNVVNNQSKVSKTEDKVVASIVLGGVSIGLLVFGLGFIGLITAVIGLILGLSSPKGSKNKEIGVILNSVFLGLFLIVVLIFGAIMLFVIGIASSFSSNYSYDYDYDYDEYEPIIKDTVAIEGSYHCKNNHYGEPDIIFTIDDEIVKIEDYERPNETYLTGGYTSKYDSNLNEYKIKVSIEEKYIEGEEKKDGNEMSLYVSRYEDNLALSIDSTSNYQCELLYNGI